MPGCALSHEPPLALNVARPCFRSESRGSRSTPRRLICSVGEDCNEMSVFVRRRCISTQFLRNCTFVDRVHPLRPPVGRSRCAYVNCGSSRKQPREVRYVYSKEHRVCSIRRGCGACTDSRCGKV